MQSALRLLFSLLLLAIPACKTTDDGSEVKRIPFKDVRPSADQNWTEARVISLNNWAAGLLTATSDVDDYQKMADEYFRKQGITDAEKLSLYTLSLRPGSECFWEGSGGYKLWWNTHRDQIKRQVESAAQFVFEFHKAMLGKSYGPFAVREVEICPQKIVGRSFFLVGQKLVIGVPYTSFGNYSPISSDKILQAWMAGDHLTDDQAVFSQVFTQSKLKKLWKLFNPIGPVRTNLRLMVRESGSGLGRRIDNLLQGFGDAAGRDEELRDVVLRDLVGLAENGAASDRGVVNVSRAASSPSVSLRALAAAGKMKDFLKSWACAAANPRTADELSHGVLSVFDQALRNETNKINVAISAGLVAVGNYHRIGVSFAAAGGPFNSYVEKPNDKTRTTEVNADVSAGLVSVFTIDDVDAAIRVMTGMAQNSVETASFDAAVRAVQNGQSLCKGA